MLLELILDGTKVFKMISSGLISVLIVDILIKYFAKQINEVIGAAFRRILWSKQAEMEERRKIAA